MALMTAHCMTSQWNSPVSPGSVAGDRGRNYLIQDSPGDSVVRTSLLRHHSPDTSGSEAIPGTGIKKTDRVNANLRSAVIPNLRGARVKPSKCCIALKQHYDNDNLIDYNQLYIRLAK